MHNDAVETAPTWSSSPTADSITPYAETLIQEQHNQHTKYYVHKVSDKLWWLLRRVDEVGDDGLPVPKFKRVREIKMVGEHLTCTCCHYERNGIPCRHIIAVNGLPSPSDVAVRWHRKYGYYYGREGYEEVTTAYNNVILAAVPGPRLTKEAQDKAWAADDAIVEEMRAVLKADGPVLVGQWAGTKVSSVKTKPDDGVYVKSCELTTEGGFEQLVSLFDYGEQEKDVKNSDAYKECLPILTDICELVRGDDALEQEVVEAMHAVQTQMLKRKNEMLKKETKRPKSDGSSDGGEIVSTAIEGTTRAAMATRLKPGGGG